MKKTEQSQLEKFKQAARDAECDTDERKFDQALGEIVTTKKSSVDEKGKTNQDSKK